MTRWRVTFEVARWEFRRFFRLKDFVLSLAITVALAGGGYAVTRWVRSAPERPRVAAVGVPQEWRAALAGAVESVEPGGRSLAALRDEVAAGKMDGVLTVSDGRPVFFVRRRAAWLDPVVEALQQEKRSRRLAEAGLSGERLQALLAPDPVDVHELSAAGASSRTHRVAAAVIGGLMLVGIWSGLAYMFVGITGEKQLRVTEQVVSAISPQTWVDGKILGLSAVAAVTTLGYLASTLILAAGARWIGLAWTLPAVLGQPGPLFAMTALALAGFAFWNTFIGAIAATVTDPNSSSRGGFIMLPVFPVTLAFLALGNPDSAAMRFFSVFPPTAPCVMLTRFVVGEPSPWEVLAALVLLLASTWLLRIAAGRVFRIGMLAYGKEPTWAELWRWIRERA
jgi:ABC-2 type transport system permease protein